jgi:sigma-B regulation protein RsbU (phosphoserine phosphatase)
VALLSRLNRLQRITLYLFALFWVNLLIARFIATSPWFIVFNVFVALVFLVFLPFATLGFLFRKITWRVRNRLIVTYFLVGVVPILLIFMFVQFGSYLMLGQLTNYLLQTELDRRIEAVAQGDGTVVPTPAWSMPIQAIHGGYKGVVKDASGAYFLAAHRTDGAGFVTRPFDNALLAELLPGMATVQLIDGEQFGFRVGSRGANPNIKVVLDSETVRPAPPRRGWWDSDLESAAPIDVRSLENGETVPAALMSYTHPSAVLSRIFSTLGQTAGILAILMGIIAGMFLVVEIAALVASVQLSRTLTSTVHDLYAGTKKVESGDFSHRIPVRANDQLSELASSFNGMTERIEQLIVEVKDKEKLESELEIARQVQAQLFPKEVPKLATLELAGVCNPARVVSGDYYDFIPIESRGAAVVVGDISGKGISAALLMASVQASLHAQLAMDTDTDISTATLVARLNRQLYANTPPEKYATFYCAVYDDRNSRLSYTNAGHLAPILIRNGQAIRLESNGTVVGIFPEYPFEQASIDLQSGDLLAAFTDGITESEDAREEQFGEDRLIELLTQNSSRPLNDIIQLVMDTIGSWGHDPTVRDDITMLLARKL